MCENSVYNTWIDLPNETFILKRSEEIIIKMVHQLSLTPMISDSR